MSLQKYVAIAVAGLAVGFAGGVYSMRDKTARLDVIDGKVVDVGRDELVKIATYYMAGEEVCVYAPKMDVEYVNSKLVLELMKRKTDGRITVNDEIKAWQRMLGKPENVRDISILDDGRLGYIVTRYNIRGPK